MQYFCLDMRFLIQWCDSLVKSQACVAPLTPVSSPRLSAPLGFISSQPSLLSSAHSDHPSLPVGSDGVFVLSAGRHVGSFL